MNIGIIGAGNIAGAVGILWARAGHRILFGARRPGALGPLLVGAGPNAEGGTTEEAARFGAVVFCSTPYGAWPGLAEVIAPLVAGKVVIDSANPYPERDGAFAQDGLDAGDGAGVPVARLLAGARFARAFSAVYFKTLETEAHRDGDRVGIPIAGDADTVALASRLVADAGFAPVVVGDTKGAVRFDPGAPVYNTGMSGTALALALGLDRMTGTERGTPVMNIGIIGAGNIGTGLGKRLAAKNHTVLVSFSRTSDTLAEATMAIGGDARAGTPLEAARFGDVVIVATPWALALDTIRPLAEALAGKVVWDATNPLTADMSGLEIGTTTSGGEEVARAAPLARTVKAIPPFAEVLHSESTRIGSGRPGVFVCGDDPEARRTVLELVADIDADGTDAGPLSLARFTEPLGMLLVQLAYVQGFGSRIGAALLRDPHPA